MSCSFGYYPFVGGPMEGRILQVSGGSSVVFPIRGKSGIRRAVYVYKNGSCGDETWTFLKFNGWEKSK